MRYEAYKSLLDTRIRCAWVCLLSTFRPSLPNSHRLYKPEIMEYSAKLTLLQLHNLYLSPSNSPISNRLYLTTTSSNTLVRASISRQLQSAAEAELLKPSNGGVIDVNDIYAEADKAFEALSILLGDGEWFFSGDGENGSGVGGTKGPTIFDAEVFAYTHLLLDEGIGWREKKLVRAVERWRNLVAHRERLLRRYYRES